MFFYLTKYLQPIEEPIWLSRYQSLRFDNARTDEELETIKRLLTEAWDVSEKLKGWKYTRLPLVNELEENEKDLITVDFLIEEFVKKYYETADMEKVLAEFEGTKESAIEFYAKRWVILRADTKETIEEYDALENDKKKMKKKDVKGVMLLDDDHEFMQREKAGVDFSNVFSLLAGIEDEDYYGWNFLLTTSFEDLHYYSPEAGVMQIIFFQTIGLMSNDEQKGAYQFSLTAFLNKITDLTVEMDKQFDEGNLNIEMIQYVGNLLSTTHPNINEYHALAQLVSILELILTHQPSFNRFNVEDSITKQFVLKTAIAYHELKPEEGLEQVKANLKTIYDQRSNIVHGNFEELNKFNKKLKSQEAFFDTLVTNCYMYAGNVLKLLITKPEYVKFLKEN